MGIILGIFCLIIGSLSNLFSWQLLLILIVFSGIIINILSVKRFSDSSSIWITVAKSIESFAENIVNKNKNAPIRADSVFLDDLFGITYATEAARSDHILLMQAMSTIVNDCEIKKRLQNRIRALEEESKNQSNHSASIYVLSSDTGSNISKSVIVSSSPTPITGFMFNDVTKKWLTRENFLGVMHRITSAGLLPQKK